MVGVYTGPDLGLVRPQATVIVGPLPPHAYPNYINAFRVIPQPFFNILNVGPI